MIQKKTYREYLQQLLQGNGRECERIVGRLLDEETPMLVLYGQVFRNSLYQVGSLWERNQISVAVEHLSTAITERLLAQAYPRVVVGGQPTDSRAVISCGINEYHQVGARMVADVLESSGWDVRFLGANTPEQDLLQLLDRIRPQLLGLSLSIYHNLASFMKLLESVRHHFPQLEIVVGGQAFRWGGAEVLKESSGVVYLPDLEAVLAELAP